MRGFYNITERIRLQLAADEFVNTVTYGDIFRVDLKKQTLFPLSHVVVNNATMENNVWRYNISIMAMDIVDISKSAVPATAQGVFRGNDNEQDVLNTQFAVLNRLLEILRSGDIRNELYQLDGNPTLEPFTERFENFLAGWVATFDVLIPNDMTSCDATADPSAICDAASYTLVDTLGNNLASGTISSGGTLEIEAPDATATIKNTAGTTIATEAIPSGATEIVTITDSALMINSASIGSVVAEGSANIIVNLDGAPSGSWDGNSWEVTSAACSPVSVEVNDVSKGNVPSGATLDVNLNVTPTSSSLVGNVLSIVVAGQSVGAKLTKTGQTVSYRTGDDGDLEAGRATSFSVLASNNPFGNTNRFTDELGGQTYTNNIVIDWSTYDGATVLGYYRTINGTNVDWNGAIDGAAALSIGTFTTGWRLPNRNEFNNIINDFVDYPLNYSPLNITQSFTYWCSTSLHIAPTIYAYRLLTYNLDPVQTKTTLSRFFGCRTFTVTGTTLT